jgi:hypothetical protein
LIYLFGENSRLSITATFSRFVNAARGQPKQTSLFVVFKTKPKLIAKLFVPLLRNFIKHFTFHNFGVHRLFLESCFFAAREFLGIR